jgi:TonB-dependent SusC/RagA subfamily outer membrane receptor
MPVVLPTPEEESTMHRARWRKSVVSGLVVVMALLAGRSAVAQGTITGRVTNEANQPLGDARIIIVGGNAGATTSEDGKYTLRNIAAGSVDLQVFHVGQQAMKRTVVVTNAATVTADFQMKQAIVQLQEIVTTATGEQRKVELGNAISTLGDVGLKVEQSSTISVSELLTAKAPGVQVLGSPVTGGAPTIRVRGISSISLSNAPIWIVDGVRYNTNNTSSAGANALTLLNNLSPEEIEDMEIVKGPSAATLYGTAAANGVIVVTTKKGRAGSTKWNFTAENRTIDDRNPYQAQYANFGHKFGSTASIRCQLYVMQTPAFSQQQGATCISDSLTSYNNLEDPSTTFIHLGKGSLYGASVSGGNDAVRFYVSSDLDDEYGPIQMPQPYVNFYNDSLHVPVTDQMFQAEAKLQANDIPGMMAILNALRASSPTIAAIKVPVMAAIATTPATRDAAIDLLFREKAFWTFGRGQRLPDLRRLVRQYNRTDDKVFPTGTYFKGGNYGTDENFPVPSSEQTNPLFHGCIDRKA